MEINVAKWTVFALIGFGAIIGALITVAVGYLIFKFGIIEKVSCPFCQKDFELE